MTTLMEKMDEIQEMTNSMEEKMAEIGMTEKEELVCEDTSPEAIEENQNLASAVQKEIDEDAIYESYKEIMIDNAVNSDDGSDYDRDNDR